MDKPASSVVAERSDAFFTASGIEVRRAYGPEDAPRQLEPAGEFPFTRGIHATMYRGRLWTRRQVVGLGTARETNARHKFVIEQGQTGLSNDFDHPTLTGYDSDHPMSRGEVGRIGVAIDTVDDMEDLLEGIDLARVSTSMTINHPAAILLAMYLVAGERRGFSADSLRGTTQNDPLKEFYAQKTFVFPPRPALRLAIDALVYAAANMPRWNAISISGYQARDAGATADQEIAFAIAQGAVYIEEALGRGADIDSVAAQMTFLFSVYSDIFEEVAKFRAARRIWAELLRDRFGAKRPESCRLRMHVQTGGATLTAQQPHNNIVRGTLQALAATLAGTQSMAVSCYDEALSIPSEHAQMMSLRVQEIIAHESGVTNTVDPLGGSYYVEALTQEVEARARAWIDDLDRRGGLLECVDSGYVEQVLSDASDQQYRDVKSGKQTIVGVNDYVVSEELYEVKTFRVDRAVEAQQIARLEAVRKRRDTHLVERKLEDIRTAAQGSSNLMPAIIEAVRALGSEGEIIGALEDVFGRYRPMTIF